jgi:serine/threonine protein phosphatase PrpC
LEGTAERIKYIQSGLGLLEGALRDAFVDIDREIYLASIGRPVPEANQPYHENGPDPVIADPQPANEDSGSTAIAVVVTPQWIVCANSGDSRSVLSRQGNKACPLSYDHKPDDYDEEKRVKAAGGYVAEGRVGGDLAVSRGLGDYRFKDAETVMLGNDFDATAPSSDSQRQMLAPEQMQVTACPDIIIRNRNPETDEFIVVACDGIWDVQSNQQFVNVVADILQEGESNIGLVCEEVRSRICIYLAFVSILF